MVYCTFDEFEPIGARHGESERHGPSQKAPENLTELGVTEESNTEDADDSILSLVALLLTKLRRLDEFGGDIAQADQTPI